MHLILTLKMCLSKTVLYHLCFEANLQILPDSGAGDEILWNDLTTHLRQISPECPLFNKEPSVRSIAKLQC